MTPSTFSVWVDYGLTVLLKVLKEKSVPEFRVRWSTRDEMDESEIFFMSNRPNSYLLPNVFAVINVGRIPCADYSDTDTQNAYYE